MDNDNRGDNGKPDSNDMENNKDNSNMDNTYTARLEVFVMICILILLRIY